MKHLLLSLSLILYSLSSAQIKKNPVSTEEANVLGRILYGSVYDNFFSKEELKKYNIEQTLGYSAEFIYEDKVLYKEIFKLKNMVMSNKTITQVYFDSNPCFKTSDLPADVSLNLMKDAHWQIKQTVNGDNICYYAGWLSTSGIRIIESKEYKKYNILSLADGKIKVKLYRLED